MAGSKGIDAVAGLARRTKAQRGGNEPRREREDLGRQAPDALAVWRDLYLESLGARNYSEETRAGRQNALNHFLAWAAERDLTKAGEITRPVLESYQRWLWKLVRPGGRRLGWSTQRNRLGVLRDWFRWLTRQNVLLHNPASELELPRPEKRLPKGALTLAQMGALLALPNVADPLGIRDRAMLEVFYSTGLRRFELCRLDLADYQAERRTLTVRRGKGHKDRVVPIGARAIAWVERYLREVRPRLCLDTRETAMFLTGYGGPFNPDVVSRMVRDWLESLGLKGSCHLLRHTCATHMLEGGADIRFIQQLLGHAKLDTTAIYAEVSILQLQEVHRRCHPSARLPEAPPQGETLNASPERLP